MVSDLKYTSTKSIIAKIDVDRETGKSHLRAVFSKYHGSPAEQGVTLLRFYMEPDKVDALLEQGDICVLAGSVEMSVFYHRDFGDAYEHCFFEDSAVGWPGSMEEFFEFRWDEIAPDTRDGSPLYLFTGDGWFVAPLGRSEMPAPLYQEALEQGEALGRFSRVEDADFFNSTDPRFSDGCNPVYHEERRRQIEQIRSYR